MIRLLKSILPGAYKRKIKEGLGVPSLHRSLQNLKQKGFIPTHVVDIGAYEGQWTLDLLEVFPASRVLMVEAQRKKILQLESICKRFLSVELAVSLLSSSTGEEKYFCETETASHIVEGQPTDVPVLRLQTKTLDTVLLEKKFPAPDFLKLDVQGHELEVLRGGVFALSKAEVCLLEVTLIDVGDNVPLMSEVTAYMDRIGYQVYDVVQLMHRPFDNALFQMDLLFVKKTSFLVRDKRWN